MASKRPLSAEARMATRSFASFIDSHYSPRLSDMVQALVEKNKAYRRMRDAEIEGRLEHLQGKDE